MIKTTYGLKSLVWYILKLVWSSKKLYWSQCCSFLQNTCMKNNHIRSSHKQTVWFQNFTFLIGHQLFWYVWKILFYFIFNRKSYIKDDLYAFWKRITHHPIWMIHRAATSKNIYFWNQSTSLWSNSATQIHQSTHVSTTRRRISTTRRRIPPLPQNNTTPTRVQWTAISTESDTIQKKNQNNGPY